MTSWSRRLRRARFALSAVFASLVIGLAVLVGLSQLALPWLVRNPHRVEAWLASRLGRDVSIGAIESNWSGAGPRLMLENVRVGAANGADGFSVPHAELGFDLLAPFQRNRAWNEFSVRGLELAVSRGTDGRWQVQGFAPAGSEPLSMGALGALVLKDVAVSVDAPAQALHLRLRIAELRVLNHGGDEVRLLGRVRPVGSEAAATLDFVADLDLTSRSGQLYVGGSDIDLGDWPASRPLIGVVPLAGHGEVRMWASIDHGRVVEVRSRTDLASATFGTSEPLPASAELTVAARAHFERLAWVGRWRTAGAGWQLDLADVAEAESAGSGAGRLSIACDGARPARCRIGARRLPTDQLATLAMLSDRVPAAMRGWLYGAAPRGTMDRLQVVWRSARDYGASAELADVRIAATGKLPGIEFARARVRADPAALLVELPEQALRIDYPHVFRQSFAFERFGGDVVAWPEARGWRIASDRIAFEATDYGGEVRGDLHWQDDGTRPAIDLTAAVRHAEVTAAKRFWPINIMPPGVVEWLDRALVSGQVGNARALVRGDLDRWPFHDRSGRFEASCVVDEMSFEFHPDWPRAEHVHAHADFVGAGLRAESDSAVLAGNAVGHASARIPDLGNPLLELDAQAVGDAGTMLDFLRATPVGAPHAPALADLAVAGDAAAGFALRLPIGHQVEESLALDGDVALSNVSLGIPTQNLQLAGIEGKVHFDQTGFAAGGLAVNWAGRPATLDVAVGGHVDDPAHGLEARLGTHAPAAIVFDRVPQVLPLLAKFPGATDWRIGLDIDAQANEEPVRKHVSLRSDLAGIAIDLPAPLAKPADSTLPFRLDLDLPFAGQPFLARLGDVLAVRGRLPDGNAGFAARVDFGTGPGGALPAAGLAIGGHARTVAAGDWLGLVGRLDGAGGDLLQELDLAMDQLTFGKYSMGASRIRVSNDAATTEVRVDGDALAGHVVLSMDGNAAKAINGEFERIHLPSAPEPESADVAPAVPAPTLAPDGLPPLHFAVADFRLGEASFGKARFDATPMPGGMRIDRLEAQSADVGIEASGTWTGNAGDSRSKLAIDLTSPDLGRMMDALGFAGLIDGGATAAHFDAAWPGPPSAFGFAKLSGVLGVQVEEGRILDVEPGAGRIFGLLSLREIPRRLSLDFSDFFRSGMGFNSINGHFRFVDGNAWTDDLAISGPAAEIAIRGRTGLVAKDYDQEMVVTPHAGATLPLVGAVAGGPVGAAAGLVMQGLLSKQIGRATRSRYHVGGTWESPDIELIEKDKVRPGS